MTKALKRKYAAFKAQLKRMPTIKKDRLAKLAKHLRSGKLGHEQFDFSVINYTPHDQNHKNGCGTSGCAMGECPFVFPGQTKFSNKRRKVYGISRVGFETDIEPTDIAYDLNEVYTPQMRNVVPKTCRTAALLFGLLSLEIDLLFIPNDHPQKYDEICGIRPLPSKATAEDVADQIDALLKVCDTEEYLKERRSEFNASVEAYFGFAGEGEIKHYFRVKHGLTKAQFP